MTQLPISSYISPSHDIFPHAPSSPYKYYTNVEQIHFWCSTNTHIQYCPRAHSPALPMIARSPAITLSQRAFYPKITHRVWWATDKTTLFLDLPATHISGALFIWNFDAKYKYIYNTAKRYWKIIQLFSSQVRQIIFGLPVISPKNSCPPYSKADRAQFM